MKYSLATIRREGRAVPVIETGGDWFDLGEVAPELLQPNPARGLIGLFEQWSDRAAQLDGLAERLAGGAAKPIEPPAADEYLTPLQYPAKLLLTGANYYDHMQKDAGLASFDKSNAVPTFFLKPPTTSLAGQGPIRYPSQTEKYDWEIELAVVLGKGGRNIPLEEAMSCVAGYAIGLDMSARDWQFHPKHPFKFDLFGGKAFDESCPIGPRIVPAAYLDAGAIQMQLFVNGELKQNANTSDMIWPVDEQISLISQHVTLEPGDVILTGTPAGVGMATGTYLKVGDRVEARIDGLGELAIDIVSATR